jgi:alpha-L-arabinofuranosidase
MDATTITLHTRFQIGPAYSGKTNGRVPYIDASAILDGDRLHVFATNRSLDESAQVRVHVADREIVALESAESLTGPDAKAANSFERPDVIKAEPFEDVRLVGGLAVLQLPRLCVTALTFRLAQVAQAV